MRLLLVIAFVAVLGYAAAQEQPKNRFFDFLVKQAQKCSLKKEKASKCVKKVMSNFSKTALLRLEALLHEQTIRARELAGEGQAKCLKKYKGSAQRKCVHKVREREMRRLRNYMLDLATISSVRAKKQCKKLKNKAAAKRCYKSIKKEKKREQHLIRVSARSSILDSHRYSVANARYDVGMVKLLEAAQACTSYSCWRGVVSRCPARGQSRRRCVRALLRVPLNTAKAANKYVHTIRRNINLCPRGKVGAKCRISYFRRYRTNTELAYKAYCRFKAVLAVRHARRAMAACNKNEACIFRYQNEEAEELFRNRRSILKLEYRVSTRRCNRLKKKDQKKCSKSVKALYKANVLVARREALAKALYNANIARGLAGVQLSVTAKKVATTTTRSQTLSPDDLEEYHDAGDLPPVQSDSDKDIDDLDNTLSRTTRPALTADTTKATTTTKKASTTTTRRPTTTTTRAATTTTKKAAAATTTATTRTTARKATSSPQDVVLSILGQDSDGLDAWVSVDRAKSTSVAATKKAVVSTTAPAIDCSQNRRYLRVLNERLNELVSEVHSCGDDDECVHDASVQVQTLSREIDARDRACANY